MDGAKRTTDRDDLLFIIVVSFILFGSLLVLKQHVSEETLCEHQWADCNAPRPGYTFQKYGPRPDINEIWRLMRSK